MRYIIQFFFLLAVAILIGIAVLRIPFVQTKLALNYIQKNIDPDAKLESINLGYLGSLELKNLDLTVDGNHISLEEFKTSFSPISLLGRFHVSQISGQSLQIIISEKTSGKTVKKAHANTSYNKRVEGILSKVFDKITLKGSQLALNGSITLPDQKTVVWKVETENESDEFDRMKIQLDWNDSSFHSTVRKISALGDIQISDNGKSTEQLKLRLNSRIQDAVQSSWINRGLGIGLIIKSEEFGESYVAKIVSSSSRSSNEPVFDFTGSFHVGDQEIFGSVNSTTRSEDLLPFLGISNIPEFLLNTDGEFSYSLADKNASGDININGYIDQLSQFNKALSSVDRIGIGGKVNVKLQGDELTLSQVDLSLSGSERQWLTVKLKKEVVLHLNQTALNELSQERGELISVRLQDFALATLDPFVPGVSINNGMINADIGIGINEMGKPDFSTRSPLSLANLQFSIPVNQKLETFTVNSSFKIDGGLNRLRFSVPLLEVSNQDRLMTARISGKYNGIEKLAEIVGSADIDLLPVIPLIPMDIHQADNLIHYMQGSYAPRLVKNNFKIRMDINRNTITLDEFYLDFINSFQKVIARLENSSHLPFGFDGSVDPNGTHTGEFIKFRLNGLTTEGLDHFVEGIDLSSQPITGAFVVSRAGSEYLMEFNETLRLPSLNAKQGKKQLVRDLDIGLSPELRFNESFTRLRFTTGSLKAFESSEALLVGRMEGTYEKSGNIADITTNGKISVLLPVLTKLPALNAKHILGSGELDFDWEINGGDRWKGIAELKLSQLRGRDVVGNRLPTLTSRITLDQNHLEKGQIEIPLTVKGKNESFLNLLLNYDLESPTQTLFDLKATSEFIDAQDIISLVEVFVPQTLEDSTHSRYSTRLPTPQEDTVANAESPWSGYLGSAKVDFKRVLLPNTYNLRAIDIEANITSNQLKVDKLNANLETAKLRSNAVIVHNALDDQPFTYASNLQIANLDSDYLKGLVNLNNFQGIISAASKLRGKSGSLKQMIDEISGDLLFEATNGKIQMIQPNSKLGRLARSLKGGDQNTSDPLSLLQGIGLQFGKGFIKDTLNIDPDIIIKLLEYIAEPEFDKLKFSLVKNEGHDYEIQNLSFISPILSMVASGKILDGPTVTLMNQRLLMDLRMSSAGELAQILNKLGILSNQTDEIGYYTLREMPVRIGGSLSQVDYSSLTNLFNKYIQEYLSPKQKGISENSEQRQNGNSGAEDLIRDAVKQLPVSDILKLF